MTEQIIWVATYERVSSDDQRDRETIKTQTAIIDQYLAQHPELRVYKRYRDDGVSGTIPMRDRPSGRLVIADASARKFSRIIFTRPSRLGRNRIDRLQVFEVFENLQIELVGISEPVGDSFMYGISSVVDDHYRRQLLAQSAEGMERAAREGRYCGGVAPLGYRVEGRKPNARLVPDDSLFWNDWTAIDVIRKMFRRSAVDGWACRRIADELNALGVPTSSQRPGGTGRRWENTQAVWTAGRVRNTLIQPVYQGSLPYGRRSQKPREVIWTSVEAIVNPEVWDAAQQTLARNRLIPKNTRRVYMLRGLIECGDCARKFIGSAQGEGHLYRCNGRHTDRRPVHEKQCKNRSLNGAWLDSLVWQDVDAFLRDPGQLLDELSQELEMSPQAAVAEAERESLVSALASIARQRDLTLDLYTRERISPEELEGRLDSIEDQRRSVETRIAELEPAIVKPPTIDRDLLAEIRDRLDSGLDDDAKREVCSLLVSRILVRRTPEVSGSATIVVEYLFSNVVDVHAGTGSSLPSA